MKCPEPVFNRKTNKTTICGAEIYGLTGLQELEAFQRHMRQKHRTPISFDAALQYRAESEQ